MGFMMHFLRKDDFFVDIGANIGTYSLLAAAVSEAFVLSFEPDDARREFFKDQVTANTLAPLIFIDGRVVSTKEETLIFSEQSVSKNIYVEAGVPRIAVSMDSLELDKTPIMVKIDAKGYDLEVVQGMRELLEHDDLKVVLCDFSDDIEEEVKNLVREIIRSKGFKVCAYDPKQRSLEEVPDQDKQLMLSDCSNYFIFYQFIFFPCYLPINNKFQIKILIKILGQMTTLIEFIVFCNVRYNDFNNCLIINCFIIPFHVFIRTRHC